MSNPAQIAFQTLCMYRKIGEALSEVFGLPSVYYDVDDMVKALG